MVDKTETIASQELYISEIKIENFKCFHGAFRCRLNKGLNILVGDNEAGKSTILEAIHLVLTGLISGRYLKTELTQYLFNNRVVANYVEKINKGEAVDLPHILIELYFDGTATAEFLGSGSSDGGNKAGVFLKIAFDEKYKSEYEKFIAGGEIKTIPIEYYDFYWESFARKGVTPKFIPIKSAVIDSSSTKNQNGSDVYISRIVKDFLQEEEIVQVYQAHRKMKEGFMDDKAIVSINEKLNTATDISKKNVKLSVDLSSKNAWENSLLTYLDEVPFHHIGKGEQCIVKTKLALGHKKTKAADLILLEEPENHLSHSKLNQLIKDIKEKCDGKQIIISTHSSFVANKLGLDSLILLNNAKTVKLSDLKSETQTFFEKLAGYDTLRLVLCKKAILVEGDSDELIVQKAYMQANNNRLPIEDGIDVISVGTSFLRFLEIAEKIQKPVIVVTDNDGDVDSLKTKYEHYLGDHTKKGIEICFDETIDSGSLTIGKNNRPFNYNTLEPKLVKANGIDKMNSVLNTSYKSEDDLHIHMKGNKTDCAIKIFDYTGDILFPAYITEAVK